MFSNKVYKQFNFRLTASRKTQLPRKHIVVVATSWLLNLLIIYIRSASVTSHVYSSQFISMPNKNYAHKQCDEFEHRAKRYNPP